MLIRSLIGLIFSLLIWCSFCSFPPGPKPFCDTKSLPLQLPLTINQVFTVDLSDYFVGYNLQYIQTNPKNFATIKPNFYVQSNAHIDVDRIISSKINKVNNEFGTVFSLLVQELNQIIILTGNMKHPYSVPLLDQGVTVETDPRVKCFDSQYFPDFGIAVVDCVNQTSNGPENYLHFVDIAKKTVVKKYNDRFADFPVNQRRKLTTFTNTQTGFKYLLRAYLRSSETSEANDNTYIELFDVTDIDDIQPLSIIDRSLMNLNKLSITDVLYYVDELVILDYYTGIHRYTFKNGYYPVLRATYSCRRFLKMAIHSDDLEDEFLIAIANTHAIHEIDWSVHDSPRVVTKYSLLSNTNITSLSLSLNYVVVSGSSWALSNNKEQQYNYTWIFNKKSRSFTNAFKVVSCRTPDTLTHLDSKNEYILLINRTSLVNFAIVKSIITLNQYDNSYLNTSSTLSLRVSSFDQIDPLVDVCDVNITVHFVSKGNISLWPTNISISEVFYSNYPGDLVIPLRKYAFGPNITYTYLKPFSEKIKAQNWVHKKNQTKISMSEPLVHPVNFLRTDITPQFGANNLIVYYQDTTNKTYLALCRNQYYTPTIYCNTMTDYQHSSRINTMATGFIRGMFSDIYINVYNLEEELNVIYIYEFGRSQSYATIEYPKGFEGNITDLDISNGILYVTLPTMKRIDGYRLEDCTDTCEKIFELNAKVMENLGVPLFSPVFVSCTRAHPEVLFISNMDSVIILDVDNHNNLVLLTELVTTATLTRRFKISVNELYLYIVSAPNTIEEYKFQDLYKGRVLIHKVLQLYFYQIPYKFDMEFNDVGNLFYITAFDIKSYSNVVLVYESGVPLVSSLYDVIFLNKAAVHNIEIEVSGSSVVDFVTIIVDENVTIIKQYQRPQMIIRDADESFGFYIHVSNSDDNSDITHARVMIANYPDNFNRSVNYPNNTVRFVKNFEDNFTWSDHGWFEGNIIGYTYKCTDCPDKIEFISHIQDIRQRNVYGYDFYHSPEGGYLLWDNVMKLYPNGSIHSSINIPKVSEGYQDECKRVVSEEDILIVTACTNALSTVSVYVTTNMGYKPFTMGPWKTDSSHLADLQVVKGLLIIVDVSPNPSAKYHNGGIYVYTLDLDSLDDSSRLQQIDYIDQDDLAGAATWDTTKDVYVGNAYLSYKNQYRLYATELTEGLIITTFDWNHGDIELNIKVVDYVNIPSLLAEYHFSMPSDATFEAVTVLEYSETDTFEIENVLITTSKFHHFQFKIVFQKSDGRIGYVELVKVYYRYGYYLTYNKVRAYNGFVVIPYIIPTAQERISNYSKHHIAIYDSRIYEEDKKTADNYYKKYIIAAQTLSTREASLFNFNLTETSNETAGLVIINPENNTVFETIVNRNLTIKIKDPNYYSQNLFLWPYSDFYRYLFEFRINGLEDKHLEGWEIALIVIGSVLGAILMGAAGWFLFKRLKRRLKKTVLVEEQAQSGSDVVQEQEQTQNNGRINDSLKMPESYEVEEQKDLSVEEIDVEENQEETREIPLNATENELEEKLL